MFINSKKAVALEYIFYQKEGKYSKIEKIAVTEGKKTNKLGASDAKFDMHSMIFEMEPINYEDSKEDYLAKQSKSSVQGVSDMFIDDKNNDARVEAQISVWKLGKGGELTKLSENKFKYNSTFKKSNNG